MASVTITELKAHLADYLRRVQNGERLHVTVQGREVADIVPADPVRAALWKMVEAVRPTGAAKPRYPKDLPINTGSPVSDIVLEDRGPYWDDPDPER